MEVLTQEDVAVIRAANEITGVYMYADDDPPEVTLVASLAILETAKLTPGQKDEVILYLASRLAERM